MKTLTADQLRKHALTTGAELEIGGAKFNSGRAQVAPPPAAPRAAPAAPPAEPAMTRADMDALLAERDAVWRQQIDHLTQAFGAALKAVQPQPAGKPARVTKFDITYDRDKCVTSIVPVYAH